MSVWGAEYNVNQARFESTQVLDISRLRLLVSGRLVLEAVKGYHYRKETCSKRAEIYTATSRPALKSILQALSIGYLLYRRAAHQIRAFTALCIAWEKLHF
jgi:hypothetical protein